MGIDSNNKPPCEITSMPMGDDSDNEPPHKSTSMPMGDNSNNEPMGESTSMPMGDDSANKPTADKGSSSLTHPHVASLSLSFIAMKENTLWNPWDASTWQAFSW